MFYKYNNILMAPFIDIYFANHKNCYNQPYTIWYSIVYVYNQAN